MKIAQACIRFNAPGGAEAHVKAISLGLARRGHAVTVFSTDLETEIPWKKFSARPLEPAGLDVRRFEVLRDTMPFRRYPVIPGLVDALVTADADLYHAHSHRYYQVWAAARAAERTGRPLVVTPHFHPPEASLPGWSKSLMWLSDKRQAESIYKHAAKVITVTESEKDFISHFVPREKCVTIPNGIDAKWWGEDADGRLFRDRFHVEGEYVLYSGRLADNKGLEVLLRAFSRIKATDLTLVLAGGDWGVKAALEAEVKRLGLGARVRFVGFIEDAATYRSAMAGARMFVLPSQYEAFGIVLLEAMARGKPVVATRVGGVPDVVSDGVDGFLVPFGDHEAMAARIDRLVLDPNLSAQMGDAGKKKALADYSWDTIVERIESVYREVMRR
ncbi:MAG: glycosyltransferase family 4 protein [Euryarchaeota archaeon]|nr:glycosyltransferase family 4 protein [Euryarchaeota archaeon]